jgi:hypothetical protein
VVDSELDDGFKASGVTVVDWLLYDEVLSWVELVAG